jgi:hypothetical protein
VTINALTCITQGRSFRVIEAITSEETCNFFRLLSGCALFGHLEGENVRSCLRFLFLYGVGTCLIYLLFKMLV